MARHARRPSAIALAALALLAGCSENPESFPDGDVDEDLAADLASLGITLYLPDLRGSSAEETEIDTETIDTAADDPPRVRTSFEGIDDAVTDDSWSLTQYRAPAGADSDTWCRMQTSDADDALLECRQERGYAWTNYEGSATLTVVRSGTVLVAGLEIEDDDELVEQAAVALMEAIEISPEDLARD